MLAGAFHVSGPDLPVAWKIDGNLKLSGGDAFSR